MGDLQLIHTVRLGLYSFPSVYLADNSILMVWSCLLTVLIPGYDSTKSIINVTQLFVQNTRQK